MISLKKYLDSSQAVLDAPAEPKTGDILPVPLEAFTSVLRDIARGAQLACPATGDELKQELASLRATLTAHTESRELISISACVRQHLQNWGSRTARHYQQKAREVKDMLLVLARTAESVGTRDQRCAGRLNEVTRRLREIATLDDLTQIRASIERSAEELKCSIDKMAEEGKAAIQQLRQEVRTYQSRLEEAEEFASRDALTGARSRYGVENHIESRIVAGSPFCVAMVDIDDFKRVNDRHGHMIGDEVLKQFASELKSICRPVDVIGRWGGDEFIIVIEGRLADASKQRDRVQEWACGNYSVPGKTGGVRLSVQASIGLAEYRPGDTLKDLLGRADSAMYAQKATADAAATPVR
jgi:diguanylate cyclase (GGDEF)-like protein